jgi:hemoglobin-like flavoprotein
MDTSDPIPNSGQAFYPTAPEETKNANTEERRKAEQALPFVDGVSQWFADAIEATNHIDAAVAEAKRRQVSIEVAVQAYDMVAEILAQKKGEFDSLKMTFEK